MSTADPFSLAGKRILVTGASSGIGRQTAISCADMGAQLIITGRDQARLKATEQMLAGAGHFAITADLAEPADIVNLAAQSGQIDGIVHAAGISKLIPLRLLKREHLDEIFTNNTYAPILLTRELLAKRRIQPNGSIVFISAIASHIGLAASSAYCASKAALLGAMRSLGLEVAKHGIRSNCLAPGYVHTPMLDSLAYSGIDIEEYSKITPLGIGEAEDIALAAVFYLSDASRWITRNYFTIDGGLTVSMDVFA
jgi:NAD(P)-dependent dehydrogenase (short-subunit alcohol dehydrogenase family)